MFCPNCGTQIPDNSVFCKNCGTRVGAVQSVTPPVQPVVPQPASPQPVTPPVQPAAPQSAPSQIPQEPPKKKIRAGLIAGIAAAVLLIAAAFVVIGMYRDGFFEERGLKGAVIVPQTIIDNEFATVRVTGITYHDDGRYFPYCIGLEAVNHTDVTLDIKSSGPMSVNGEQHSYLVVLDVPPGETLANEDAIGFFHNNNKIKTITFKLEIRRLNSDEVLYTSDPINLETSLAD